MEKQDAGHSKNDAKRMDTSEDESSSESQGPSPSVSSLGLNLSSDSEMDVDDTNHESDSAKATARGLARHTPPKPDTNRSSDTARCQFANNDQRPTASNMDKDSDKPSMPRIVIKPTPPPRTSGFKPSSAYKGKKSRIDQEQVPSTVCEPKKDVGVADPAPVGNATEASTSKPSPVMDTRTNPKQFKCHLCHFTTTTKGYLARHLNKRHPFTSPAKRGYDPKSHATAPSMRDDGERKDMNTSSRDTFDFTPRPIKRQYSEPGRNRDIPHTITHEEPMQKNPKVEPYVPKYVGQREHATPRLIPMDNISSNNTDPRRLYSHTRPDMATKGSSNPDLVPETFKLYVLGVVDTKLATAMKGLEDRLDQNPRKTVHAESQTNVALTLDAGCQTDITMSQIFEDPGTATEPSGPVDVPVMDDQGNVMTMTAEVVKLDPAIPFDHTY